MGWTWVRTTKIGAVKNILQERNRGEYNVVTRKDVLKGDILWSIHDVKDKSGKTVSSFIQCAVLKPSPDGWGWNTMPEELHPFYYDVPLEWLDEVPQPKNEPGSQAWRDAVRRLAGIKKPLTDDPLTLGQA